MLKFGSGEVSGEATCCCLVARWWLPGPQRLCSRSRCPSQHPVLPAAEVPWELQPAASVWDPPPPPPGVLSLSLVLPGLPNLRMLECLQAQKQGLWEAGRKEFLSTPPPSGIPFSLITHFCQNAANSHLQPWPPTVRCVRVSDTVALQLFGLRTSLPS